MCALTCNVAAQMQLRKPSIALRGVMDCSLSAWRLRKHVFFRKQPHGVGVSRVESMTLTPFRGITTVWPADKGNQTEGKLLR
jgi:hypothetical protein